MIHEAEAKQQQKTRRQPFTALTFLSALSEGSRICIRFWLMLLRASGSGFARLAGVVGRLPPGASLDISTVVRHGWVDVAAGMGCSEGPPVGTGGRRGRNTDAPSTITCTATAAAASISRTSTTARKPPATMHKMGQAWNLI